MTAIQETIHRANFEDHFTTLFNPSVEDQRLTWQAKGLLWYLISRPKNWSINRNHLSKIYTGPKKNCGKDAVDEMFRELIDLQYITYTKNCPNTGKMIHRYDVYPMPYPDFQKMFPKRDIPFMVKSPPIPNNDNNTNNLQVPSEPVSGGKSQTQNKENVSDSSSLAHDSSTDLLKKKKEALRPLTSLTEVQVMSICKNYTLDSIEKAVEMAQQGEDIANLYAWLCKCMREEWWLTADPEKTKVNEAFNHLKQVLLTLKRGGAEGTRIDLDEHVIYIGRLGAGGIEITRQLLDNVEDYKSMVDDINKRFMLTSKLTYANVNGKHTFGIANEDTL